MELIVNYNRSHVLGAFSLKVGEKISDKKRTPATEESVYILAEEPRFT